MRFIFKFIIFKLLVTWILLEPLMNLLNSSGYGWNRKHCRDCRCHGQQGLQWRHLWRPLFHAVGWGTLKSELPLAAPPYWPGLLVCRGSDGPLPFDSFKNACSRFSRKCTGRGAPQQSGRGCGGTTPRAREQSRPPPRPTTESGLVRAGLEPGRGEIQTRQGQGSITT